MKITDDMVERLVRFLQDEWAGPYMGRISEVGKESIKAADAEAHAEAMRVARRALEVTLEDLSAV